MVQTIGDLRERGAAFGRASVFGPAGTNRAAPARMDPRRLQSIIDLMHWTPTDLSRILDCQPKIIRRWLGRDAGPAAQVPDNIRVWLEAIYEAHSTRLAVPKDWKRAIR